MRGRSASASGAGDGGEGSGGGDGGGKRRRKRGAPSPSLPAALRHSPSQTSTVSLRSLLRSESQASLRSSAESLLSASMSSMGHLPELVGTTPQRNLAETTGVDDPGLAPPLVDPARVKRLRKVGGGLHGQVWEGVWNGRRVTAKQLADRMEEEDREVALTEQMRLLCKMRHPNLVPYFGMYFTPPVYTLLSEFVNGRTLRDIMDDPDPAFPWPRRQSVAFDVACALAYLHARRALHRDLRSSNILVARDGTARVCDYGLAHVIHTKARARAGGLAPQSAGGQPSLSSLAGITSPDSTGPQVGLEYYLPPEMLAGSGSDHTKAADVFCYGLVLFELTSGLRVLEAPRVPKSMLVNREILMKLVPPKCPDELSAIMRECCAGNPRRRPTFEAICFRFGRARSGKPEGKEADLKALDNETAHWLWTSNFGRRSESIPWDAFRRALVKRLRMDSATVEPLMPYICCTPAVDPDSNTRAGNSAVTVASLSSFCKLFGFGTAALQRASAIVTSPWFHGVLSSSKAAALLRQLPPGSFLVRIGRNCPHNFTISLNRRGSIQHILVRAKAPDMVPYTLDNTSSYKTLAGLLDAHRSVFQAPVPVASRTKLPHSWSVTLLPDITA